MDKKKIHRKGFTLVELLVTVVILGVVSMTLVGTVGHLVQSYHEVSDMQKNIEKAQFAVVLMAKVLRTSTIIKTQGPKDSEAGGFERVKDFTVYDFSQGRCIRYRIFNKEIQSNRSLVYAYDPSTKETIAQFCLRADVWEAPDPEAFVDATVEGLFTIKKTNMNQSRAGLVGINLKVYPEGTEDLSKAKHFVWLNTSVSLRDFFSFYKKLCFV